MDVNQRDLMWEVMKGSWVQERKDGSIQTVGKHDVIWREGETETQLKIVIERGLELLIVG